jgi:hypothetical protein
MEILKKLFRQKKTNEQKLKLSFLEGQLSVYVSLYGIVDEHVDDYVEMKKNRLSKKINQLKEKLIS